MENKDFGTKLRELRKKARFSQRELADKIGVSFTYLSKIESGATPPPSEKVVLRLAEALNIDKDELLTLAGKIPPDIAQILRSRETLQLLRKARAREKSRTPNIMTSITSIMRGATQMKYKKLARIAIAATLVVAIGTSLWFSAPPIRVRAFDVVSSVANSPVSGNVTHLMGENVTVPSKIKFDPNEFKVFQSVSFNVTGPETFGVSLPLEQGDYQYSSDNGVPGNLFVNVNWDPGVGPGPQAGYGYAEYGYGYSTGSGNITYTVKWKPPYTLTTLPAAPPALLPGMTSHFTINNISLPDSLDTAYPSLSYPQGVGENGTYLYTLIPAYYTSTENTTQRDLIIKTNRQGTYVNFIPAPGASWTTEAITFVGGTLYAGYNTWDYSTWGSKGNIAKWVSSENFSENWTSISVLSNLDAIGGLASDGTNIFIAYRDELKIEKRNPSTGAVVQTYDLQNAWGIGMWPPMWGFDALAYDGTNLYAAQQEMIIKIDPANGAKLAEYKTNKWSIRGLEFVEESFSNGTFKILYIATTEWPSQMYRAAKAGDTPETEKTPIGNYTTSFQVVTNPTTYTRTSSFKLGKLSVAPTVTISAPSPNFAVGAGSENITVTGSINDPSISQVTVGILLPEVTAFQDDVENQTQTNAKWEHAATSGMNMWGWYDTSADLWHRSAIRANTGSSSWRYANPTTNNYATTGANAAALKTKSKITLGTDNKLIFWTWYDTEFDFWPDRKIVEASTDGVNWVPLAWLAKFWPPFQPPDMTAQQFASLRNVPERTWTKVEISLTQFNDQQIYLRFRFDSMDDWSNNFEGWYIDDVSITGVGFLGQTVSLDANLQFSTIFTLAEGNNTITARAVRSNYDPKLTGEATVSGSLDKSKPTLTLNAVTTPTNQQYQTISGTVVDNNFDRLEIKNNGVSKYTTTVLGTGGTFSYPLQLSEGSNTVFVEAKDKVGLTDNRTALISLDSTGPVFNAVFPGSENRTYDVAYQTGEISARPGDFFFLALKVTDNSGVASVKLVIPQQPESQWPSAINTTGSNAVPEAVIDSWGISAVTKAQMNYVLPMRLPSGLPAGDYSWTVIAKDAASNSSNTTAKVKIVTTLEAFNIYLLPDWNLVATPVIPTTDNITVLTTGVAASGLFERAWYYDASKAGTAEEWKLYVPGVGGDLTTLSAGRGYWFKMKNTDNFTAAGKVSGPMAAGLPNTPAPIKLTISGQVLQAGAVIPPTYSVYAGWNLIGLHSEYARLVSTALTSITVPQQKWGSVLQYLNYIKFPMEKDGGQPEIDLGRFDRLISTSTMEPGRGFWIFMMESGTIVP